MSDLVPPFSPTTSDTPFFPLTPPKSLKELIYVQKHEKTMLFIDGANIWSALGKLDSENTIDYKATLAAFKEVCDLKRAYYYTAVINNSQGGVSSVRNLLNMLSLSGYTTVTKDAKNHRERDGSYTIKGNMDCDMTVDVMRHTFLRHIDHAVLFTGDGDFVPAVKECQEENVRVTIVATLKSKPTIHCSDELLKAADNFLDLYDLLQIAGRPRG